MVINELSQCCRVEQQSVFHHSTLRLRLCFCSAFAESHGGIRYAIPPYNLRVKG